MPEIEWTGGDLPTFVTHLECGLTGERYECSSIVQDTSSRSSAKRPSLCGLQPARERRRVIVAAFSTQAPQSDRCHSSPNG